MLAAADHAERIGLPFNRHWTVHYQAAGIAEDDATRFVGHLLKLAGDYARRHKGKIAVMWARENGESKGSHVQILVHFRADLSLVGCTPRWVRHAGDKCVRGVSHVRAIGDRLLSAANVGEHYRANADTVRAYLLKGATRSAWRGAWAGKVREGGEIVGKRCGWTQNIGRSARQSIQ